MSLQFLRKKTVLAGTMLSLVLPMAFSVLKSCLMK